MSYLKLYGGVVVDYVGINEDQFQTDNLRRQLDDIKFQSPTWGRNTKLLATFNNSLSGSNVGKSLSEITKFKICKTIGDADDKLHEVFVSDFYFDSIKDNYSLTSARIIEDFACGNACKTQYYVFPIARKPVYLNGHERIMDFVYAPSVSNVVEETANHVSIIGLIATDSPTVFDVDLNNVWCFRLGVSNKGTTLNMDKTIHNTQYPYAKISSGNRKYDNGTVSGMIGRYDCNESKYIESFELFNEWESFAVSNIPKLMIDIKGRLFICDIDSTDFSYGDSYPYLTTVNFSFQQIASINDVTIHGRKLRFNPLYYQYLADIKRRFLKDANKKFLIVPTEEEQQ